MRKSLPLFGALLLLMTLPGCIHQSDSSDAGRAESLLGTWQLASVRIESRRIKWNCEKESTTFAIVGIDTLLLDARFPEFKVSDWRMDITSDSIRGPIEVEARIRFDWAFTEPVFIEQEFLNGAFGYVVSGDTLFLSNRLTEMHRNHRLFYTRKRLVGGWEIFPGQTGPDTIGVPSPKPDTWPGACMLPDSTETKARLVSVVIAKI